MKVLRDKKMKAFNSKGYFLNKIFFLQGWSGGWSAESRVGDLKIGVFTKREPSPKSELCSKDSQSLIKFGWLRPSIGSSWH